MIHPPAEKAHNLAAIKGIRHGFFGRRCGNSGDTPGLNTSETLDDDPDRVAANRRLAMTSIGVAAMPLASLQQTHSADVLTLNEPYAPDARPEADGLVTSTSGIALSILTADCAPILFADETAGIIGACHAGWQGAVNDIIANTISAMTALGANPAQITAAIGPTISGKNYEVGPEFAARVIAMNHASKSHIFLPKNGTREHFDLPGFIITQLGRAGVTQIEIAGGCTYQSPAYYFSHRHTTKHATPAGRQISIIALG